MNTKTEIITEFDVDALTFELQQAPAPKKKEDYVDNKKLFQEFIKYNAKKQEWIADGCIGKRPPLTNVIGQAIMDIAHRRCYSRNFIGYTDTWKEEMVSDAIETCVKYVHNFNPEKSNNPFAYITQLVTNAIINRIKIEQKETYIKYKSFDMCGGFSAVTDEISSDDDVHADSMLEMTDIYKDHLVYIDDYERKIAAKKKLTEKNDCTGDLGVLQFVE